MARPIGKAIGVAFILLGLLAFTVTGTTWRKDAWSDWRADWQPQVVVQEKTPWILLFAGATVLIVTRVTTGSKSGS